MGGETTDRSTRRARAVPLSLVVVLLVVVAVTVRFVVVDGGSDPQRLLFDGARITNAGDVLRSTEREIRARIGELRDLGEETAVDGDGVRCWFAYPAGDERDPDDTMWCGPLMFADSAPDTHWLPVLATFEPEAEDSDRARASATIEAWRTTALADDVELRRPDGDEAPAADDVDLERPRVARVEPGTVGTVNPDELLIDLTPPEDGRLIGLGYRWTVQGSTTTDRVRMVDGEAGVGLVRAAASGEKWLLFQGTTDDSPPTGFDPGFEGPEVAIEADGTERIGLWEDSDRMGDPFSYGDVVAVSVPEDADDLALVVDDGVVEQSWSFLDETRIGAPEVLYRDQAGLTASVDEDFSLSFTVRRLDPGAGVEVPGSGEFVMTLEVVSARLGWALEVGFGEELPPHTASAPDRALLSLDTPAVTWSDARVSSDHLAPEDAVVVLPDGTEIPATQPGSASRFDRSLMDDIAGLVWEVPADIGTATIRLTFPLQEIGGYEFDFGGGVIEIPVDFG